MYLLKVKEISEIGKFNPEDIWLFTDPVAKANFRFKGNLLEVEHDIRFNVMRGKSWQEVDLEYLHEIKRLCEDGFIKKTTSFWFSSPFTPIYKALQNGKIVISNKKYPFKKGEEIAWQCQMGRELLNLNAPVLIGIFTPKILTKYCKEMENAIKGKKMMITR